jgi:hypothetical protein
MIGFLFRQTKPGAPRPMTAAMMRSDRAVRYEARGFLPAATDLADPGLLPAVAEDAGIYNDLVRRIGRAAEKRVPYFSTDAVRAIARDPAIVDLVADLLDDDAWVMWGANIQQGTPNAADAWHVDLESWFWPSVTVVVGLRGCAANNATWFIPGSHRLPISPGDLRDAFCDDAVLATSRAIDPACDSAEQVTGFADGRFYVFNARTWHRGAGAASRSRQSLFLHYQRAADPRIPCMKDYTRQTFFRRPADYFDGSPPGRPAANASLYAARRWRLR